MNSSKDKKETTEKTLEQLLLDEMWRDITKPDVEKIESILKAGVDVNARIKKRSSYLLSEIKRLHRHLYHSDEDRKKYDDTFEADRITFYNNYPNLDLRVVKLLLQYGADVNYVATDGINAIHYAVLVPIPELFELLLEYGADPNCKNEYGHTVLDRAYTLQCFLEVIYDNELGCQKMNEIFEVLKKHGAKFAVYGE